MRLHVVNELDNFFGRHAALLRRPGRRFLDSVGLAHHIVAQLRPAISALGKEGLIGLLRAHEFMNHAEHQGTVGTGTRRYPFTAQIFGRIRCNRIDRNGFRSFSLQRAEVARPVVKRRQPVDVIGN